MMILSGYDFSSWYCVTWMTFQNWADRVGIFFSLCHRITHNQCLVSCGVSYIPPQKQNDTHFQNGGRHLTHQQHHRLFHLDPPLRIRKDTMSLVTVRLCLKVILNPLYGVARNIKMMKTGLYQKNKALLLSRAVWNAELFTSRRYGGPERPTHCSLRHQKKMEESIPKKQIKVKYSTANTKTLQCTHI